MTKEQKIQAYAMLMDGESYQEVADKLGMSKQQIWITFSKAVGERDTPFHDTVIYPNIKECIKRGRTSLTKLATASSCCVDSVRRYLKGKLNSPKGFIDAVLSETGMTYEEAFFTEEAVGGRDKPFHAIVIYPNIKECIKRGRTSLTKLATASSYSEASVRNYLSGRSVLTKDFIDAVLSETGMTYEEAFSTEEGKK